jgi:hypothetical protein
VELNDASNKEAASYILKRLRTVMLSPLGACIGRPSTIRDDANLLCYAMTGLENSPKDIHVLSLAVQAAVLRRTLKSKASMVFFDEVSIQLEFIAIAKMISILCANGAKAGIRVILAMQDPNTLAKSRFGAKIIQNLSILLFGRITDAAIESFQKVFRLDESVIALNASKGFFPDPSDFSSNWLIKYKGVTSYVKYYPSIVQLALVANNPHETMARKAWIAHYKDDPIEGFIKFAEVYSQSIQTGKPIPYPISRDPPTSVDINLDKLIHA